MFGGNVFVQFIRIRKLNQTHLTGNQFGMFMSNAHVILQVDFLAEGFATFVTLEMVLFVHSSHMELNAVDVNKGLVAKFALVWLLNFRIHFGLAWVT